MRIAYANAFYNLNSSTGGNVHVDQFIQKLAGPDHDIWTWFGDQHPKAHHLSKNRIRRWRTLRKMDVIYIRLEFNPPGPIHWTISPYRQLIGSPIVVWEFNTVPEFGYVINQSETDINRAIQIYKSYGRHCDLAVCVSRALSNYVQEKLGIKHVITVPNGSDPDLFKPDAQPVQRMQYNSKDLKVVWIGSANLSWHNFDLVKNAAKILWDTDKKDQITFHIIGDGLNQIRDYPPNVYYYGREKYEYLPGWLSTMDVGLVLYKSGPSYFGSPLKLFDYMSSGLTVVGSKQPQLCEVFEQLNQLDLLVSEKNAQELVNVLTDLAYNRDRVHKQGDLGRELVIEFYNWHRATKDILSAIERINDNLDSSIKCNR